MYALQAAARDVLHQWVTTRDRTGPGAQDWRNVSDQFRWIVEHGSGDRPPCVTILGAIEEVFSLKLALLLTTGTSQEMVVRCPACNEVFVRTGKMKFCSRRCSNRVSRKIYLTKEEKREKDRQAAHERYKRKFGNNVKVRRRPQKRQNKED
jgi:hypothetical protein